MSQVPQPSSPGTAVPVDRMPGHWLLASLGRRVLRPGGRELTRRLLDALDIGPSDDVVEVAPGLGATTRLVLDRDPATYVGVDRDPDAVGLVAAGLAGPRRSVVHASAADTGLDDASADVAFGEAYLTMQPVSQKARILTELARITRTGGRIGLHEVAFTPDDIDPERAESISDELMRRVKVNVAPLTTAGWIDLVEQARFGVTDRFTAPLRLLEPRRVLADEGLIGAARFVSRVARRPDARRRMLAMRSAMRGNRDHLQVTYEEISVVLGPGVSLEVEAVIRNALQQLRDRLTARKRQELRFYLDEALESGSLRSPTLAFAALLAA